MRLVVKVAALVTGAVAGASVGLVSATGLGWAAGFDSLPAVAVATGLCVSTTAATLVLADVVFRRAPGLGPVAILVGTAMRMAVAVVGVVLLGELVARAGTSRTAFAGWVAYLYIVTLALECGLLMAGSGRPGPEATP